MVDQLNVRKPGRPKGTKKDPNRLKILNPNGRKIDVGGIQYNRYLKKGYAESEDGTRLKLEEGLSAERIIKRGRPKKIKTAVNNHVKVENPDTKRMIKTDGLTFKNLSKKYYYHPGKNEFYKFDIRESKSSIKGFAKQYTISGKEGIDEKTFLSNVKPLVIRTLTKNSGIKFNIVLTCEMKKDGVDIIEVPFLSKTEIVLEGTDIIDMYKKVSDKILESINTFQMRGSNWRFKSIVKLDINTVIYKPLRGSSYFPLPPYLANKKAIINMKNKDDQCFKWCVTRGLNPIDRQLHQDRITKQLRIQAEELNWNDIKWPTSLNDINKFERNNMGISINVYGFENCVYPLRLSKVGGDTKIIDLLLLSNDVTKHYCLIKNFSRLMTSQSGGHTLYYCKRCLNGFREKKSLDKHIEHCKEHDAIKVELPSPGTILNFKNHYRSMRVPFIVYADFESFLKPIDTCQPNPVDSYTNKYQKHIPSSFCYYIKCFDDKIYSQEPVVYTSKSEDDDVAQIFVNTLEQNIKQIYNQFKFSKKMIFKKQHAEIFNKATKCHICDGEFSKADIKVRDHCHLSGKFRGAAHDICNLKYRVPKFYPVVFHNLSGYDTHLFIKKLHGNNGERINCIPTNEEKYISFGREVIVDKFVKDGKEILVKRELRFIDSFKFMASSLDALSKNLHEDQCKNLNKYYSGKQRDLLLRKGVYPYDYVDSISRFSETKLPSKSSFYSKLNDSDISNEDYEHAQVVWREFGFKTFKEYHNLYNVSDVLLLADVFENFRDVCMNNYKLDPAWYFTSPGLAWDSALKITEVQLELLSDIDMLLMIKHGIRGGVSSISNRYAKANNKYMREAFDNNKPSSFITYLDCNNLYGCGMSKSLPTGGFEWMSQNKLDNWKRITNKEGAGCILEVDLEYPDELHDLHNDYPLAPESLKLEGSTIAKLIPNLNNKKKYIVHYDNLKLYESLGLKITKIHRGIKFNESTWLKKYIDLNTGLRTKANNDFEKDFFKLMNNSVFGKTMENIENYVDIRLVTDEKQGIKLVAKPNFDRSTIFDENLVAIHMKKIKLFYNKPIYLGMCILDLSKTVMYDFHYNYIKKKYVENAKLLFTDTDSLAYEIHTDDFYDDIRGDIEDKFDTSDFPNDHPSNIKTGVNKKVIGMFKDETGGKQIEEFVGLRSKLYSYKMFEDSMETKKCKGIKKTVIQKSITHEDYKACLFTKAKQYNRMNVIRSYHHDIYTEELNKIALSADDDKRIILNDGIHTLAYGHYKLK